MDIKKDHINFAVGPVQISEEISRIGADPVPYFRTPDFSALMKENEALLKEFMDAPEDARAVFLTGSGTASMDAVTQNVFTKDDRLLVGAGSNGLSLGNVIGSNLFNLLVVAGGSFGHRFCEICEVYGIPHTAIELRQGHALTSADLAPYAGQGYTGFLVNMHETSTGVLYDMDMISAFCRENGLVLVVDAISAFLADDVSMKRWGADVVFTGSQKALAVPPGISMMVLSSRAVERIYANRPACYYLDLKAALKNGERGQTPFTPAVGILIQINARLNQIKRDGFANVQAQTRAIAKDFRSRIGKYPFHIVSDSLSYALTPLSPNNPEVSAHQLFLTLKDEYGIIICPNGGELADKVFRVGHIGHLTVEDNDALFRAFDDLMARGILKA